MRVWVALLFVVVFASTAHAQQSDDDVSLELGFGAGYARALHGDLDFGDGAVSGTARARLARHTALEAQVGYWQHTEVRSYPNLRGGVSETRQTRAFPSVTFSVVAVSPRNARVGPYGGAGVGVYYIQTRYVQSPSGGIPDSVSSRWNLGMGGQFFGGVDVRAAKYLKIFGEARFAIESLQDPGSAGYRLLGGVRVSIG